MSAYTEEEPKHWEYMKDEGELKCRCPTCKRRLYLGRYRGGNPFDYCPYCGEKLEQGHFNKAWHEVYGYEGY